MLTGRCLAITPASKEEPRPRTLPVADGQSPGDARERAVEARASATSEQPAMAATGGDGAAAAAESAAATENAEDADPPNPVGNAGNGRGGSADRPSKQVAAVQPASEAKEGQIQEADNDGDESEDPGKQADAVQPASGAKGTKISETLVTEGGVDESGAAADAVAEFIVADDQQADSSQQKPTLNEGARAHVADEGRGEGGDADPRPAGRDAPPAVGETQGLKEDGAAHAAGELSEESTPTETCGAEPSEDPEAGGAPVPPAPPPTADPPSAERWVAGRGLLFAAGCGPPPTFDVCSAVPAFAANVRRAVPGRFFWSGEAQEPRTLALYRDPDVVLVLREPADPEEARRPRPEGEGAATTPAARACLVVESVADLRACTLRLSPLTTPTSVPSGKNGPDRRACFEIRSPTETIALSAASRDGKDASAASMEATRRCEETLAKALIEAHSTGISVDTAAWQHQVILGTLHSHVVAGNNRALAEALDYAARIQKSRSKEAGEARAVSGAILDAKDSSGRTALHHACARRDSAAVRMLVGAGADGSAARAADGTTPCHVCARNLDEKSLSIVLAAARPTRPNPNALDRRGWTPAYLAAVSGGGGSGTTDAGEDARALDLCLSALEAWGGGMTTSSFAGSDALLHPVHCVAAQWRPAALAVVLSHCRGRHPSASAKGRDPGGASLGAVFHYPLHAALGSLRTRIAKASTKEAVHYFGAGPSSNSALVK